MKPLITPEPEEWIPTPEEEAMLEEAYAAEERGEFVDDAIVEAEFGERWRAIEERSKRG